jgi:hypothetical protein
MMEAPPPMSLLRADDHALADAPFNHGRSYGSGVEVDEALVHDGRSFGQVGAEPHSGGVGYSHAAGDDVVQHGRKFIHGVDLEVKAVGERPLPDGVDVADGNRAERRPAHIREDVEYPVQLHRVRLHQAVGEEVQSQVGIGGVGRRLVQVGGLAK